MIGVGVVGYGYWGPNLVRNFAETPGAHIASVSDLNTQRLELAQARYPYIQATTDVAELIRNPRVDLVAISTPVSTHFDLALRALRAGKHVLVEKPLTRSSEDGLRLIEEAERRRLQLFVDHTFTFTGSVRKLRELVQTGELGQVYYYDSTRVNLGLFQHDVDVIWDLAVHDLAIMHHVLPVWPVAVSTTGICHVPGGMENIAYMTMFFQENVIAHVNVNWLSPVKVRRTMIGGSRKMVVYDDLEVTEKLKVYDKGITVKNGPEALYKMLVQYRTGDMWAPQLDTTEALALEAGQIVQSIETGVCSATDGRTGLRVVRLLEAATQSMRRRGQVTELQTEMAAA
ncbi:MAG: Gfo/Idh/MocA family oxidoreductase [Acidobacteriaceae bacterium]|nr:Gfo/Idh/MocA family oxidoreductase [Acidobacteriaceae bacterium]